MHCYNERMISNLAQNISFSQHIVDIRNFSSQQAFGDDLHGQDLGGVTVTNLKDFAECSLCSVQQSMMSVSMESMVD